jgi:hypothetical protein
MEKQDQRSARKKKAAEQNRPEERVTRDGDQIEEKLDDLDRLLDEALDENEESAERRAQEFVDEFKQKGGE